MSEPAQPRGSGTKTPKSDAERAKASYERKKAAGWSKLFVDPGTRALAKQLGGFEKIPKHVEQQYRRIEELEAKLAEAERKGWRLPWNR